MKNILAEAEIKEEFGSEFAIYDLPEFLRSIELFDSPKLNFNGGANVTINEEKSKQNIKYFFADKSVIVAPTKSITMPDKFVSFAFKGPQAGQQQGPLAGPLAVLMIGSTLGILWLPCQ